MKLRKILGGLALALWTTFASAALVSLPRQLVVDANGEVRIGAKLYVYQAGSTTPLTLYTTNALSATQANPVVSSSSGLFAAIYLASTVSSYKLVLKDSADVTIYTEDNIPAGAFSQSELGAIFYPKTANETANGSTIVRYYFPPGNLKRYTSNNGDGTTDVSSEFETMLNSGEGCDIPYPDTSWVIDTTVDWVAGVYCDANHSPITSTVGSGNWTFLFDGIPYASGAGFSNFVLTVSDTGAKGIQLWESRNVRLSDFEIVGPSGIGGYGIEINGGDDASPTYGSAHNFIENCRVYRMAAGLRLYTDNTTTPSSNTAFANRNFVYGCQLQTNTEGLFIDRANTNELHLSLQANTEGADVGQYAKNNMLFLIPESNTRAVVLNTSADDNWFGGTVQPTDFVNSGGTQVNPNVATIVSSSNTFQLPRDVVMPTGGALRLENPYSASSFTIRPADTIDIDLCLSNHDSADTKFDIFCAKYNASAPYADVPLVQVDQVAHTQANVASATNITYVATSDLWRITGTTTINTITAPSIGNPVLRLLCTTNVTINDKSTSAGNITAPGSANISCTDEDVVTLVWDSNDSEWLVQSVSAN